MEDEGILSTSADGQELPEGAIRLSPFDQTLDVQALLDGEQVSDGLNAGAVIAGLEVTSPEADFLMPLDSGRIYVEQNDDRQWRTADIDVRLADGSRRLLTLAQPPATRASAAQSRRNFYRHHGVGYSYEAVGGEYCNMNYVRCQLLNRAIIDQLEQEVLDPGVYQRNQSGTQRIDVVRRLRAEFQLLCRSIHEPHRGLQRRHHGSLQQL